MKKLMALAAAFIITNFATVAAYDLSKNEKAVIAAGIAGDPVFATMKASETDESIYVCGIVNVKNQYGQYMGDSFFVGVLLGKGEDTAAFNLLDVGTNPVNEKADRIICQQHGLSF